MICARGWRSMTAGRSQFWARPVQFLSGPALAISLPKIELVSSILGSVAQAEYIPMAHPDLRTSLALALTAALAACAPAFAADQQEKVAEADEPTAREQGGRQCFFARSVTGFRTVKDEEGRRSDRTVLIDVRASDTFEVKFAHRCPDIRWARAVGFSQTGPGRICDGLDVDLIVPDVTGPQRCVVESIRKLAPGEPGTRAGSKN